MLARRLDTKLQITICIALAISAYVMVNVELPPSSHIVSALSVVLFAVPTFLVLRLWLGVRDAFLLFVVLGAFALAIELLAITTGFPYGHFNYSEHLGSKLFGVVPWTVSFAWPPLLLGAYSAAANLTDRVVWRLPLASLLMVAFDLVLDPGAVRLGFWSYAENGWFYGVPASNFAGWIVSGLVGAALLEILLRFLFKPLLPVPVQLVTGAILIIFFWCAIAIFADLHLAVLVALGVQVFMSVLQARRGFDFDDKIVLVDGDSKPLGTASKLEAHDADTPLHLAFSVFLFNRSGELLMQQRAFSKKTWPGVWSNTCCGHVMLHEGIQDAAARRVKFELGISGVDLTIVLPDFRYRAEKDGVVENEICPVLVGFTEDEPRANPAEVAATKWVAWSEFLETISDDDSDISPWAIMEAHLLAGSEKFRELIARHARA